MRRLAVSGYALSISLAAALLSACGGSSMPIRASDSAASNAGAPPGSKTFKYSGKKQTFVVPAGVRRLTVVARGAEGGGFAYYPSSDSPGRGGRVYAIIPVHPGEKLYVFVGGSGTHGGFNGGGAGGASGYGKYKKIPGYPGGGASDVRKGGDALPDRIIVAAGGGGTGEAFYYYGYGYGGSGGGLAGESGGGEDSYYDGAGGSGATQTAGGSGGAGGHYYESYGSYAQGQPGGNGALGLGGSGGNGSGSCDTGGGGGGGGGYYGAGGGGGGAYTYLSRYSCYPRAQGGGGGGGSSYVEPSAITSRMWTGWKKAEGDGLVVFSWN